MIRLTVLALLLAAPALAADPPGCPDDAVWQGRPPPHGDGYQCIRTAPDGRPQRHGWTVLYDPISGAQVEACEYRDGVRHGRCTLFSDQGDLRERGTYDRGARTGSWWFWAIPTAHGPRLNLALPLGDPTAAGERRDDVENFLLDLGAAPDEATALGEVLLNHIDRGGERRQVCGEHLCIGPGRIPTQPIYVALGATPEQTRRDARLLTTAAAARKQRIAAEQRVRKLEAARQAREAARQAREEARQAREEADALDDDIGQACCRYCSKGKPCGDTCIARNKTCRVGPGCAC